MKNGEGIDMERSCCRCRLPHARKHRKKGKPREKMKTPTENWKASTPHTHKKRMYTKQRGDWESRSLWNCTHTKKNLLIIFACRDPLSAQLLHLFFLPFSFFPQIESLSFFFFFFFPRSDQGACRCVSQRNMWMIQKKGDIYRVAALAKLFVVKMLFLSFAKPLWCFNFPFGGQFFCFCFCILLLPFLCLISPPRTPLSLLSTHPPPLSLTLSISDRKVWRVHVVCCYSFDRRLTNVRNRTQENRKVMFQEGIPSFDTECISCCSYYQPFYESISPFPPPSFSFPFLPLLIIVSLIIFFCSWSSSHSSEIQSTRSLCRLALNVSCISLKEAIKLQVLLTSQILRACAIRRERGKENFAVERLRLLRRTS